MELSVDLNQKIVNFLTTIPNIHDSNARQTLIENAGLDDQLKHQIVCDGPTIQFSQALISTLIMYGKLNDGRSALRAFLESTKDFIGQDKRTICDILIRAIDASQKSSSPNIQFTIDGEISEILCDEKLTEFLQRLFMLSSLKRCNRFNLTLSN